MHVCMYVCMYVYMYVYMHVCMYIYIYIYACMNLYMYVCMYNTLRVSLCQWRYDINMSQLYSGAVLEGGDALLASTDDGSGSTDGDGNVCTVRDQCTCV